MSFSIYCAIRCEHGLGILDLNSGGGQNPAIINMSVHLRTRCWLRNIWQIWNTGAILREPTKTSSGELCHIRAHLPGLLSNTLLQEGSFIHEVCLSNNANAWQRSWWSNEYRQEWKCGVRLSWWGRCTDTLDLGSGRWASRPATIPRAEDSVSIVLKFTSYYICMHWREHANPETCSRFKNESDGFYIDLWEAKNEDRTPIKCGDKSGNNQNFKLISYWV